MTLASRPARRRFQLSQIVARRAAAARSSSRPPSVEEDAVTSVPTRTLLALVALVPTVVVAGSVPARAGADRPVEYRVTLLGSLGGSVSRSDSVNDVGLVSGYSNVTDGTRHAVVWQAD
jgi:hypothetical protein